MRKLQINIISITSIFFTIMERVSTFVILNFFFEHKLISKHQHGFLSKFSTTTNLLDSINDWTLSLKNKRNVTIAYVDYSKAFDVVSHPKLLLKLTDWGINGNLLSWIKSFLSNRTHCTRVGNAI